LEYFKSGFKNNIVYMESFKDLKSF